MITNKQRSIAIFSIAGSILMVPLIAMQFTNEVKWSGFDFLVAGILLFTTTFLVDLVLRKVKIPGKRFFYIALLLILLFLIWAELAVGIFGSPVAGS